MVETLIVVLAMLALSLLVILVVLAQMGLGQERQVAQVVDFLSQEFAIYRLLLVAVAVAMAAPFSVAQEEVRQEITVPVVQLVVVIQVMILQDHCQDLQEQHLQQAEEAAVTTHSLVRLLEEVKAE
jgi:uncharacterized BrkB/YihY/UPF0761 family membrane protein